MADGAARVNLFTRENFQDLYRPAAEAFSPPPWYYTSEEWFQAEVERIFRREWNCVGRVERVPNPGDYVTFDLAGHALVLIHGRDGVIRAFHNHCRHRGARLLNGSGNCRAIVCPYHSWTYGLDGTLAGAPDMEASAGFAAKDYGLKPVRCEVAHGFVFVNLDPHAGALAEFLGDFGAVFQPYDLANMVSVHRHEFECACNWKASAEVFMEYYHTASVHPLSLGTVKRTVNPPEDIRGSFATMFSDHAGTRALIAGHGHAPFPPIATLTGRAKAGTRYSLLYPGMALGLSIDAMWYIESYPVSAGRTRYALNGCFPKSTVARADFKEKVGGYIERWETAAHEDNVALERQHKGFLSPHARPGRIQPGMESIVARFGRWVVDRVVGNA